MNEVKTENSKVKLVRVHNGTLQCVGDVMQIEGDFEIEFDNCECKCGENNDK